MRQIYELLLVFGFASQLVCGQSFPSLMDYYGDAGFPNYGGGSPYLGGLDLQQNNPATIRRNMVKNAQGQIGSEQYTRSSKYRIGKNKDKCHIFVFDVIQESDGVAPQRFPMFPTRGTPISAKQWRTSRSMAIKLTGHFKICPAWASAGDIIACGDHVAVVTGTRKSVLADPDASPNGLIAETDFGFRKGQKCTCWRYV